MDIFEAITTTRAIRRYTDDPVTDEEIRRCLAAAVQAPSGGNIQPWQFLVITDVDTKRAVGDIYRRSYARYEPAMLKIAPPPKGEEAARKHERMLNSARYLAEHIGEAPAMVAFLMPDISMTVHDDAGAMDVGTPYASVYPAVQNFMLAARGLGIGTAMTTVYRVNQDEMRELLGVPPQMQIIALVPMGRPKGHFGVAPRRPADASTHWERFGNKTR